MTKILIVDDEQNIRSLLQTYLELEGFEIAEASNVEEAEALLSTTEFELVTLDISMPGESGMAFLARIHAKNPSIAVLMVTLIDNMATAKTAIENGAYGYVRKPFAREDLIIGVYSALRRREIELARRAYQSDLEYKVKGRTKALALSEKRFGRLVERMTEGLTVTDQEQRIIYVNLRCCEMLGYREEELLGQPFVNFVDQQWLDHFQTQMERRQTGAEDRYELILRTKSGDRLHTIVSPAALFDDDGTFVGAFGVITDITELKKTENELLKQLTATTALADTAGRLVSEFNMEEIVHVIIAKAERLTRSEFGFIGHMDPSNDRLIIQAFSAAGQNRYSFPQQTVFLDHQKGPWQEIIRNQIPILKNESIEDHLIIQELSIDLSIHRFLGVPARLGQQVIGLIGLCNAPYDYSEDDLKTVQPFADLYAVALERTWLEEERETREDNLREILSSVPAGIMLIDSESGLITDVNHMAVTMLQSSQEETIGRPCLDFADQSNCADCPVRTRSTMTKHSEQILLNSKGQEISVLRTIVPIDISGRPHYMQIFVDISEQKKMEFQLAQAQKLESIGQLASGIAHEINTPTQYVGDNTRFLKDVFDDLMMLIDEYDQSIQAAQQGAPMEQTIERIGIAVKKYDLDYLKEDIPRSIDQTLEGVDRIAQIIQSMRQFAHNDQGKKAPIDLHKMIESTATVAKNEYKYVADLKFNFDKAIPLVPCYAGEFNQVMLNLLVNAAHAIGDKKEDSSPEKGTITIGTKNIGEWVEIQVTDTGAGIPARDEARIFDPFFTTKEVGKGTGQGLAIAHAVVVEKHGGKIWFETEIGRGTTFFIHLPLKETEEPADGRGRTA